ncbi:MAG: MerR family transcriptional regulator [Clostridia bacterium]|nr:MerR family transcriptional regulator [Clostridia bacterium]
MSQYTTGEVAKLCAVSVRTVQYYDARGVLSPTELSEGGRRLYSEDDVRKMRIICFLRGLGFSLNNISTLMQEENSQQVISLLMEEQEHALQQEIAQKQSMLDALKELQQGLTRIPNLSVESIGDVVHIMNSKKQLKKIRLTMVLSAIPLGILQWGSIILWIATGIWWPFVLYVALGIPYAAWISIYYFKRVDYICPQCHEVFHPTFKESFWANHTPSTRKLTCPKCGVKSFCVETAAEREKKAE